MDITRHAQALDLAKQGWAGEASQQEVNEELAKVERLKGALRKGVTQGLRRGKKERESPYKKARAAHFAADHSPDASGSASVSPVESPEQIEERLNRRIHAEQYAESAMARLKNATDQGLDRPGPGFGTVVTTKRGARAQLVAASHP